MTASTLAEARPRSRSIAPLASRVGWMSLVAASVFWIAYDDGGYSPHARDSIAIAVWWVVLLGLLLGLWSHRHTRAAVVATLAFAGFTAWNLISVMWDPSAADAVTEFNRSALYLGVFVLAVLAVRRVNVQAILDGLAIAIGAVAAVALVSRLFPGSFPGRGLPEFLPSSATRLSFPVDYWNGLGILLGMSSPLFFRYASVPQRPARLAAAGVMPALVAAIYLTSSRGAAAVLVVAVVVYLAAVDRRLLPSAAVLVGGAGGAAAVWMLGRRPQLVNGPVASAAARGEGRSAALILLIICGIAGLSYVGLSLLLERLPQPSRWLGRVTITIVAVAVAAAVAVSHPVRRFDQFKALPAGLSTGPGSDYVREHLLSGSGSGRWQFWTAALDEWRTAPLAGRGAGSYESWWAQHASFSYFVEDAHSLYLEVLGELGVVGLALLLLALAAALAAGVSRARRSAGADSAAVSAALAGSCAYLVGAGIDWMWELTVVSFVGFLLLGLLVSSATVAPRSTVRVAMEGQRRPRVALAIGAAAAVWAIICVQAIPLLAGVEITRSQAASRVGDVGRGVAAAQAAEKIEPWAPSPYLQLALVHEQAGQLRAAEGAILEAIGHDPLDWRLWIVRVRLETKLGETRTALQSLRRAQALNPRSPLLVAALP